MAWYERIGAVLGAFLVLFPVLPRELGARELIEEVAFDVAKITIEGSSGVDPARDQGVAVRYPGAVPGPPGAPDLPRVPVWIAVPEGMRVKGVRGEATGLKELGTFGVRPVASDVRAGEAALPATADRAIYDRAGKYPNEWASFATEGSLRGHHVAAVWVMPVRWETETGRLECAAGVRVTLELEAGSPAPAPIARQRVVSSIERKFEAGLAGMVRGLEPAAAKGNQGDQDFGSGPAGPGPYQPTFSPSPDGSPVEYVIVTSQALANAFDELADWKTKKGVQAAVRTIEWIDQTYPNGVDRAERVRFFIRDAYQNWGTLYVLLGGDTDVVPVRYAQMVIGNGEPVPTDYYYGCLDGNWNADGDDRIGESMTYIPGDQTDLLYEVHVGRAPVSTALEAQVFVEKTLAYETATPPSARYPASILALAERLYVQPSIHGADIAEDALAFVPSWFRVVRLYEESASYPGSVELTLAGAIDSVNAGFGIVHHVGHGFRNSMSLGSGTMSNADADNLENDPRFSVVFAINCSSASIDFNSIGERWVKNPAGGAIAYIGTSRFSFLAAAESFQAEWYATVFDSTVTAGRNLAAATDLARLILVPSSLFDGGPRWNLLATMLLGDPEVDLYTKGVIPIQVTSPASVPLGSAPITVQVMTQGSPLAGASVTLWKENEVYVRGSTGADGRVVLPVGAIATGPIALTVHKSAYRVHAGAINITAPAGPVLYVLSAAVDDDMAGQSIGDGDGFADAGETIELRVTLRNSGSSAATAVTATLTENDPGNAITITPPGTVSYPAINAGNSSAGNGAFRIQIAPSAPVAYQPVLTLNASSAQGSWTDVITLPIRRPYLEHYAHTIDDAAPRGNGNGIVEAGEEIWYRVTLRNTGQDRSANVTGALVALRASDLQPHPLVTVGDGASTFGTIVAGGLVQGDRFAFTLGSSADPATLLLRVTLNDALGQADVQLLDVIAPAPADSLKTFGSPTHIRVAWKRSASPDTRGYDIERALQPGGPFTRINSTTVDGSAVYEDANLSPLTRYYYRVVTRDSSYNASPVTSMIVSGTTNPPLAAGWPIEMDQQSSSSLTVSNTSGGPDLELFTAADYECAWHPDGTEVRNGDGDAGTSGPFAPHGFSDTKGFAATTAIGDLDDDNDLEIVNVAWTAESVYVWNHLGGLVNGWPKGVLDDFNWPSPVLADLDGDHNLEVIVWAAKGGRLFAWHHNGIEVADGDQNPATNGVLYQVPGNPAYNYSSPAVAQIDADPQYEIIICVNISSDDTGKVYAINHDGTLVSGWPYATGIPGEPSQVTSSPAVGDLDGNGTQEIVVVADRNGGTMFVLNGSGQVVAPWPRAASARSGQSRVASPSLADIDGDGFLDIVYPGSNGRLYVFKRNGDQLPGFPITYATGLTEASQSTASIADIDGDPGLEILFGDETGKVHAYNNDGSLAQGFPIQTHGEVRSTPIVWDLDQDQLSEVAVVSWDANVYVWDLPSTFNPLAAPWPFFRHDVRNTGWMNTARVAIGIDEPEPSASEPIRARLERARPNPFNPSTMIGFTVPGQGARPVSIGVYDPAGRLVRLLLEGPVDPGRHDLTWDGRDMHGRGVGTGIYFLRAAIGGENFTEKLVLLK